MAEPVPTYVFWLDHVKVLIERETRVLLERIDGIEEARRLQTDEITRRLEELSRAHDRAVEERGDLVRRVDYTPFHDSVLNTLSQHRGRDLVVIGFASIIGGGLVTLMIRLLWDVFAVGGRQ